MTRKAFTLVETLLLIGVVPVLMIATTSLYATLVRDIPRTTRVLQQNTTMLDMLQQLRADMDRAVGLPSQVGDDRADERTLLIELPEGPVTWRFEDGRVVRTVLTAREGASEAGEQRSWRMRDAVVTWEPWVQDGRPYAIEVHSHVNQRVSSHLMQKFAGTHVFFVYALGKDGQVR